MSDVPTPPSERGARRRKAIQSFKAKLNARRSPFERLADWLTTSFGTVTFFLINAALFAMWIGLNTIDPYPFNFLTMVVSLEAIFLSIIVLISQNRKYRFR